MSTIRENVKHYILSFANDYMAEYSYIAYTAFVLIWISVSALIIHVVLHRIILRLLTKFYTKTSQQWLQTLSEHLFFRRIAYIVQGVVVQIQVGIWLEESSLLYVVLKTTADLWILLFSLLVLFSLLNAFQSIILSREKITHFPLRGGVQTVKLISSLLVSLIAVSLLMGKSPLILLSGLGALSAVLMLVFKDPILGLVAGIQLSVNNMLAVGDWLEMPKYNADGDVIDIGLTTVKVQNWDKTITTIPTYSLISDSFKNWRGMSESGGRRIKRNIFIDTTSIRFLNNSDIEELKKANLLNDYLDKKTGDIDRSNKALQPTMHSIINGRRLTNIGTFRGYLVAYLQQHPHISQSMTLLVRQLEPTHRGLPIQIYTFTNTTNWLDYEDIQSDIFDHIFAVLNAFDLRVHESPTGKDVRALAPEAKN